MSPTTVQDGAVVSLQYTLKLDDGQVIDESPANEPLQYLHGASNIIPGLENALTGMTVGDSKQVIIAPADAYGEYNPDQLYEFERALFPDTLELSVGLPLTLRDESGNLVDAVVAELSDETVTLDFNHPLAGQTLHFDVTIIALRDATPDEMAHGHAHAADHHH